MRRTRVRINRDTQVPSTVVELQERVQQLQDFQLKQHALLEKYRENVETEKEHRSIEVASLRKKIQAAEAESKVNEFMELSNKFVELEDHAVALEKELDEAGIEIEKIKKEGKAWDYEMSEECFGAYQIRIAFKPSRPVKKMGVAVEIVNDGGVQLFKDVAVSKSGVIEIDIQKKDIAKSMVEEKYAAILGWQNHGACMRDPS